MPGVMALQQHASKVLHGVTSKALITAQKKFFKFILKSIPNFASFQKFENGSKVRLT